MLKTETQNDREQSITRNKIRKFTGKSWPNNGRTREVRRRFPLLIIIIIIVEKKLAKTSPASEYSWSFSIPRKLFSRMETKRLTSNRHWGSRDRRCDVLYLLRGTRTNRFV